MAITPFVKKASAPDNSGSQLLRGVLQVGGGIVGGIYGGPAGAAAGSTVGGMVGGAIAPDKEPEAPEPSKMIGSQTDDSSMQRRFQEMNNSPSVQIADANAAMAKMPPEIQQEYGPVLTQAQKLSMNRRV